MWSPPSAAEQVDFLQKLQRLLAEGSFVASYKYALLQALADLAVLRGDDSGAPLTLATRQIAEAMIQLYWRQAAPFPTHGGAEVLRQNTAGQAGIVSRISRVRREYDKSLAKLREDHAGWSALVSQVDQVVRKMPLWKLQRVGDDHVLEFLYPNVGRGMSITLHAGVAYCLRAFHGLVSDLIRGAWLRYIRRFNADVLGDAADLSMFLFGSERADLGQYRAVLIDLQSGRCFYCRESLRGGIDVDHFIPWARYPSDLGHNFVLAHSRCNQIKSDHLPSEWHLEAWLERNDLYSAELGQRFDAARIVHDLGASVHVARWAYAQTERTGGQVWSAGRTLGPLSPSWINFLTARGARAF